MLKLCTVGLRSRQEAQPPSGGCVLKLPSATQNYFPRVPAAFGRLCVETALAEAERFMIAPQPPSGGCVLKLRF